MIDTVVRCELVWVLDSAYGYAKSRLADTIEAILLTAQFEIDGKDHA